MCTRILNNIDTSHATVGRCMDWEFMLPAYVYAQPAKRHSVGVSKEQAEQLRLAQDNILFWEAEYASISTQVGDDGIYGTDDGMNEKGLVVNVLYDADCDYGPMPETKDFKALSVLRWGQFILDCFATVKSAVEYFQQHPIHFISESVPGDDEAGAELHVAISDSTGDSAIIEVHDGEMTFYQSPKNTIATNQPSYEAQLVMSQYWFYLWGLSEAKNSNPVYTSPGGDTPVQRFQRACFYRYMHRTNAISVDRLMQVRSMINTCSVPLLFQADNHGGDDSPYTLWINLADSQSLRYHFLFTDRLGGLEFDALSITETKRIKVTGDGATTLSHGLVNASMEPCQPIFAA